RGKQQLLVTALLSDGHREDVTDKVLYVSNNKEVARVSPDGLVEPVRTGETAIIVRAAGQFATVGVGVIPESKAEYPAVKARNFTLNDCATPSPPTNPMTGAPGNVAPPRPTARRPPTVTGSGISSRRRRSWRRSCASSAGCGWNAPSVTATPSRPGARISSGG